MATIDVLGEEITTADEARRDRAPVPRRARADPRRRARLEHLGEADRARARARRRALPGEPRGGRRRRARPRQLRPDRHGGLVDDRRHARALPRAARGRARQRRRRAAVAPAADARRRRRARQRAALQGHLPRAARDRVRESESVRANFVRCLEALLATGQLRGGRDARRGADRRVAAASSASGASPATTTSSRCCSASARTARPARPRRVIALRVYVPYGTHWYEYSLRRLQENPKLAGYVAADTVTPDRPAIARAYRGEAAGAGRSSMTSSSTTVRRRARRDGAPGGIGAVVDVCGTTAAQVPGAPRLEEQEVQDQGDEPDDHEDPAGGVRIDRGVHRSG